MMSIISLGDLSPTNTVSLIQMTLPPCRSNCLRYQLAGLFETLNPENWTASKLNSFKANSVVLRSSSTTWSRMFLDSMENEFLSHILLERTLEYFAFFQRNYPKLIAEATHWSPESLEAAASQWNMFTKLFRDNGIPVPDCPQYVEIQRSGNIWFAVVGAKFAEIQKNWTISVRPVTAQACTVHMADNITEAVE
jgi:hypothetical protein